MQKTEVRKIDAMINNILHTCIFPNCFSTLLAMYEGDVEQRGAFYLFCLEQIYSIFLPW